MKKSFAVSALAFMFAMSAVFLYAQESLSGKWTLSAHDMSLQMVLLQDGEKISGTLESPHGEIRLTGDFGNGKLTLTGETESKTVLFSGLGVLLSDGSLSGNLFVNQIEMKFTAIRRPDR